MRPRGPAASLPAAGTSETVASCHMEEAMTVAVR